MTAETPYLPDGVPFPDPPLDAREFWRHCAERRLMFQTCADCATPRHPPTPLCPNCQSTATDWRKAPTDARIYSYTIVHNPSHQAVADRVPYNVAVIEFPDLPGVKLVSNVVDAAPNALKIGLAVVLEWQQHGQGPWLPRFKIRG